MEQPGLEEETVQEARVLISRKLGGIGECWLRVEWLGEAVWVVVGQLDFVVDSSFFFAFLMGGRV